MKNIFSIFLFATFLCAASCNSNNSSKDKDSIPSLTTDISGRNTAPLTTIAFTDTLIDFGTKPKGEMVHLAFKFKNTGSNPLFIKEVHPSCGCTIADYPKEAIAPGGEGEIKADFDTNKGNDGGPVHKSIAVFVNDAGEKQHTLLFTGNVAAAKF